MTSTTNTISTSTTKFRPSTTGRNVKKFRTTRGYTQEFAAALLGLSRGQLSSIETGYVKPSKNLSARILGDIAYYTQDFSY